MKAGSVLLAVALCVAAPLAAQEAPVATVDRSAPVSASTAPLPGPRVRDDLRRAEPAFTAVREPVMRRANHTIVISTLVLVLIVVILVLLIV